MITGPESDLPIGCRWASRPRLVVGLVPVRMLVSPSFRGSMKVLPPTRLNRVCLSERFEVNDGVNLSHQTSIHIDVGVRPASVNKQ